MGNQLCPANNKDLLKNFEGLEKGDRSVSELVANYFQGKKDESSVISGDYYEGKGELTFTPMLKFRPD
jgi:hypothetical protein